MVIAYLANIRLPTEKAHGLQIVQNCEALGAAGASVTLVVPRRINTPALAGADVWSHYGVERTFAVRRVPCLDLFPLGRWFDRAASLIQLLSYCVALVAARSRTPDAYYSRDVLPILAMGLARPSGCFVYEAHQLSEGRFGAWLQRRCLRRASTVIAVTDHLAADLRSRGAARVIVLRDGFRAGRFADVPDRAQARRLEALPDDAIAIGYVGRLETMGMSKGVNLVIEALARLADSRLHLCLVGGAADQLESLRALWIQRGLTPAAFHAAGDRPPAAVPAALVAFDVCVMPLPWTPHFAYRASPLKLFEYLSAGRAIVASALPSVAEVVRDGETALLVPPADVDAWARALARLRDDAALRERLGAAAKSAAAAFTWTRRAARILQEIGAR